MQETNMGLGRELEQILVEQGRLGMPRGATQDEVRKFAILERGRATEQRRGPNGDSDSDLAKVPIGSASTPVRRGDATRHGTLLNGMNGPLLSVFCQFDRSPPPYLANSFERRAAAATALAIRRGRLLLSSITSPKENLAADHRACTQISI